MHTIGTFLVTPSLQISKLKVNETSFHSVTLASSVTPNGDCTGTQFSDPYGTWNSVVVQAIFKITMQEHYATIHLNSNKIQLGSGIICTLSNTFCTDVKYIHYLMTCVILTNMKLFMKDQQIKHMTTRQRILKPFIL